MIAVAMSGGVDSSAAAALLRDQGEEIVGLSMQLWNQRRSPGYKETDEEKIARSGRCCSIDDIWDARRVATHLGMPFYVLNLEGQFEETVVAPFVDSYLRGETPSPCILCNNFVKFHHLVDRAAAIGADRVATGHYARVRYDEALGRWLLLRGKDRNKDQSYFLFGLTQDQLSKTVFPLGELTKPEVREIAKNAGLPTYDKAESQEICFVQGNSYAEFVENYAGIDATTPGEIVDAEGGVVGTHTGIHKFTVGQRKGLVASGRPQYVTKIEPKSNRIVIGENAALGQRRFTVRDANWIAIERPSDPIRCDVQIRNRFEPRSAIIAIENGEVVVEFDEPQRAVTPGQGAVFYWEDVVVGGGWIKSAPLNYFNYFTEIENFYQTKRESFTLISSLDWVLIENWKEQGIPLEIVLKGIDRAFSRSKRRINSLAYCIRAIDDVLHEDKEARIEKPDLPEIPREETQRYIDTLAEKTAALSTIFPEFAPRIASITDAIRTIDPSNFRDGEQTLTALEERLIAILKVASPEATILEIQHDVTADLAPCRATMTAEQLSMLEQQLWRRKLMERYNLARLSLFYLI